jgi:hypothetical protein
VVISAGHARKLAARLAHASHTAGPDELRRARWERAAQSGRANDVALAEASTIVRLGLSSAGSRVYALCISALAEWTTHREDREVQWPLARFCVRTLGATVE